MLSQEERDALPSHMFAVPGKRRLPIHDERHVRMAESMLDRTKGLSYEERKAAKTHILRRAHELGIDTDQWLHAVTFTLDAMSLNMPDDPSHPNRMPFSGILTRVDEPSDQPPGGAGGKRVYIPKQVATQALPSLMVMGVDCTEDFSGHDNRFKIGVITTATIDGNAVHIAGSLYADDFPEECARIKQEQSRLGFSYECKVAVSDMNADPWVVDRIVFTGAAILYKDKAAYHSTSLAAKASEDDMDLKEIMEAVTKLTASVATIGTAVTAQGEELKKIQAGRGASLAGPIIDQAMPHVGACNAAADAMEAAGIGTHPTMGHAHMLRKVGASILHAATMGKLPHIFNDHSYFGDSMHAQADPKVKEALDKAAADLKASNDSIAALTTQLTDLKAALAKIETQGGDVDPKRKTLSAGATALAKKYGLDPKEGNKLDVGAVDAALIAAGVKPGAASIAAKLRMQQEGLL